MKKVAWLLGCSVAGCRFHQATQQPSNSATLQSRRMIRARVITCSDAASAGAREDRSGPAVRDLLSTNGFEVDEVVIVPDDVAAIATALINASEAGARLIVTTGGTGIAARDVTPEATESVCDRL